MKPDDRKPEQVTVTLRGPLARKLRAEAGVMQCSPQEVVKAALAAWQEQRDKPRHVVTVSATDIEFRVVKSHGD